jgi:hypothetical protein
MTNSGLLPYARSNQWVTTAPLTTTQGGKVLFTLPHDFVLSSLEYTIFALLAQKNIPSGLDLIEMV